MEMNRVAFRLPVKKNYTWAFFLLPCFDFCFSIQDIQPDLPSFR